MYNKINRLIYSFKKIVVGRELWQIRVVRQLRYALSSQVIPSILQQCLSLSLLVEVANAASTHILRTHYYVLLSRYLPHRGLHLEIVLRLTITQLG